MRLDPQNSVALNITDGFGYSFWFYDNNSTASATYARGVWLQGQTSGGIAGITFSSQAKEVFFRSHGDMSSNYDPDVIRLAGVSFYLKYEYKTWNNIIYLKKPGGSDTEVWFNGKLVAHNPTNTWNYPGGSLRTPASISRSAVRTRWTPSASSAAEISSATIRPCATGERSTKPERAPSGVSSAI